MDLILKKECRNKLRKPLGKLVSNESELLRETKNSELITIGDKVTQTVLELGLKPKLAIIDYNIERRKIEYDYQPEFKKILFAKNKPGTISEDSVEKIKEALQFENCLLEIDGEEDLLTLPVILEAENNIRVCYGQPKEGIVIVDINEESKEKIKKLLKECFL